MMRARWWWWMVAAGLVGATPASAAETVVPLVGDVADDGVDHVFIPFDVPEGTVEIEVRHGDGSTQNVLDWGLRGPDGFRGWGGGNEEPAIVGMDAASRSYVPGPIPPGRWNVVIGKAKLVEFPVTYDIEVVLRDEATLAPQSRSPYVEAAALGEGPAWYAGDFHVHSIESGDARPDLDEIATFARGRGLDFVVITDHNVHTAQDFFAAAQPGHPGLLFVPGVEFTTYAGHANAVGSTQWVDHKIGQPGVTIDAALVAYHDQGALVSINHPTLDLGPLCIGCAWDHAVDGVQIDAVEIANGGLQPFGWMFSDSAIAYWDDLCAQGHHVAALGGSDDHKAGVDLNQFQSPIGDPTTLVYAQRLDVTSLLEGIRNGRTVVKLQGPDDPTVFFDALEPVDGDTIASPQVTLRATITGGAGQQVRLVSQGIPGEPLPIDADPFETTWTVEPPPTGQARHRVEVLVEGQRRVVTSHLWVELGPDPGAETDGTGGTDEGAEQGEAEHGCACTSGRRFDRDPIAWGLLVFGIAVVRRRR